MRLAAAGHQVRTPDLYDGEMTDNLDEGLVIRDRIGRDELYRRALESVESFRPDALIGFSLGASIAQRIAMRTGAVKTLVLFHGVADVEQTDHLKGLRIQAHIARGDPWAPDAELETWSTLLHRSGAQAELRRHDGGHLFTDPGLRDFDYTSSESAWTRALEWLAAPA